MSTTQLPISKPSVVEAWFDEFVATLRSHQLQLEKNVAREELKLFYDKLLGGDDCKIAYIGKELAQQFFVKRIIVEYLNSVKDIQPLKIAFDYNDSEVLVWTEINENDEATERALLKAEAVINARYHSYGFDMESTIVETSDNLNIPNHYKLFKS